MVTLITADNRVLENGRLKGNFIIQTDKILRSDEYFTGLKTDKELKDFMKFCEISELDIVYGYVNEEAKPIKGKVHIKSPDHGRIGSICGFDTNNSTLIKINEVKRELRERPQLRMYICKKCMTKAFPARCKTPIDVLNRMLTKRQLRENKASGL